MNTAELLHQRKEGILAFTFVELLILMVFASIMFAIAIEREVNEDATQTQTELDLARKQLDISRKKILLLEEENSTLLAKVRELEISLDQYRLPDGTLANGEAVKRYISNLRPSCVVPSDYLFSVVLQENGDYKIVRREWFDEASGKKIAAKIDGLNTILSSSTMSIYEMKRYGRKVFDNSEAQTVKCRYRVDASSAVQHSNLSLYLEQVDLLQKYFFVKQPKLSQ